MHKPCLKGRLTQEIIPIPYSPYSHSLFPTIPCSLFPYSLFFPVLYRSLFLIFYSLSRIPYSRIPYSSPFSTIPYSLFPLFSISYSVFPVPFFWFSVTYSLFCFVPYSILILLLIPIPVSALCITTRCIFNITRILFSPAIRYSVPVSFILRLCARTLFPLHGLGNGQYSPRAADSCSMATPASIGGSTAFLAGQIAEIWLFKDLRELFLPGDEYVAFY